MGVSLTRLRAAALQNAGQLHSGDAADHRRMKCLPRETKSNQTNANHDFPFRSDGNLRSRQTASTSPPAQIYRIWLMEPLDCLPYKCTGDRNILSATEANVPGNCLAVAHYVGRRIPDVSRGQRFDSSAAVVRGGLVCGPLYRGHANSLGPTLWRPCRGFCN